jgi:hypothetical protein
LPSWPWTAVLLLSTSRVGEKPLDKRARNMHWRKKTVFLTNCVGIIGYLLAEKWS